MNKYLSDLIAEREGLATAIETLTERASGENRDLNDKELGEVQGIQARCADIDSRLQTFGDAQESNRKYSELLGRIDARSSHKAEERKVESTSWGTLATESAEFRGYSGRGSSGAVEVPFDMRAALTTEDILPANVYRGFDPVQAAVRYPLIDAVGKETVSSGSVEWVEVGFTSAAAVVAEGALKPEAAFTFTPKTAALDTLAHWVAITRQTAEDYPRLQSLIEGKLRQGLLKKIEADLATAIGAGVTNTAEGADLMAAIRVGVGEVEALGYSPNAVLVNPADYADLDIAAMVATVDGAIRRASFWGLRTISVPGIAAGTAIVGDASGVTLFSRGAASVLMSDSHADFFIRNQLLLLAETRVKSAVTEPDALVKVSVTAP